MHQMKHFTISPFKSKARDVFLPTVDIQLPFTDIETLVLLQSEKRRQGRKIYLFKNTIIDAHTFTYAYEESRIK